MINCLFNKIFYKNHCNLDNWTDRGEKIKLNCEFKNYKDSYNKMNKDFKMRIKALLL